MSDAMFPVEVVGGVPVVGAPDAIDITNAGQFRAALLACSPARLLACSASGAPVIVVDMSRTHFCGSSGLHVLVAAHKRVRADGGEMRLVIPAPHVLRVFAISGLDRVFPCHRDLDQAVGRLSPHQPSVARCA